MSIQRLLVHRGTLMRLTETEVDGISQWSWKPLKSNVAGRVDLSFIRAGKDPQWTPEAGRPSDRTGVLFLGPDEPVKVGDRWITTLGDGVDGTFLIDGNLERNIGRHNRVHHLECGIREVAPALAKATT